VQVLTINNKGMTPMAGSAGGDGSMAHQEFRVRLSEALHVYEFSVEASGVPDNCSITIYQ